MSGGFLRQAKQQIGNYDYAILSYSILNNAIVIEFTGNKNDKGVMKVSSRENNANSNSSIAAKSFFNHYNLDITLIEGRYIPKLENISGIGNCWVVYLNEKENMSIRRRSKMEKIRTDS